MSEYSDCDYEPSTIDRARAQLSEDDAPIFDYLIERESAAFTARDIACELGLDLVDAKNAIRRIKKVWQF